MGNEKITTMAAALEAVGIKTQQNGKYRPFDDVMGELWDKWPTLEQHDKQQIANMFVRCML